MRRAIILSLPLFALVFCVPWAFTEASDLRFLGLPLWAVYALGTATLFAVLVAVLIGCCWNHVAGGDHDDATDR
ncbi:MAG: hypothetical protein ACI8T1_003585 [Verrucomicrobiales bacterium]|jgi:hypothetical protein